MFYLVYFDKCGRNDYGVDFNLVCITTNEDDARKMCEEHNANLKDLKAQAKVLEKEYHATWHKYCQTKEKSIKDVLSKEIEKIENQINQLNAYKYCYMSYENNTTKTIACYVE